MSSPSSKDELPTKSTTNKLTFLDTCVLDADHSTLEEHLMNNPVQQSDLDSCLLHGLRMVQREERELSCMAPALALLLKFGAKWNSDALLDDQKTPLHIICESPGDHHQLLDLVIKSSPQTTINTPDMYRCTALLYAVRNEKVNNVKCLIANGADVTIGSDTYTGKIRFVDGPNLNIGYDLYRPTSLDILSAEINLKNPIMEAIRKLSSCSGHSSTEVMSDIFDLLFDIAVEKNRAYFKSCTAYISCAVVYRNVYSVKKLIKLGAPLDTIAYNNYYAWELVASMGNVELLTCMIDCGIDKYFTDDDSSILWHVVTSGNIESVRYLLDIGVAVPNYTLEERTTPCEKCKGNRLIIQDCNKRAYYDPCMRAIYLDNFEIMKLLDVHGSGICKSFTALRCALLNGCMDVISYLLNKYTYPLNIEYITESPTEITSTLLTECVTMFTPEIMKLLLDHGADPARPICSATGVNAIMAVTYHDTPLEVIARYIRSGVNINSRSWAYRHGNVSPFELSVLLHRPYISVMLLISGCSRGVFNKRKFKAELENLMKEWNVYDNNVIPLKQRCRCVILNHLSPRADLKIENLPLPPRLIKFLSILELDNIVYKYSKADKFNI